MLSCITTDSYYRTKLAKKVELSYVPIKDSVEAMNWFNNDSLLKNL